MFFRFIISWGAVATAIWYLIFFFEPKPNFQVDKGAVLGAAVARAQTESLLPQETYFAQISDSDIKQTFERQKIIIYPEDIITSFPDLALGIGAMIKVTRATPVKVADAGKINVFRSFAKTVQDLFEEKQIVLAELDRVEPSGGTALSPNLMISITRVEKSKMSIYESIGFATKRIEDKDMDKGKEYTKQAGKKGKKELIYEVTRENGIEVKRILVDTKTAAEPVDELIIYGTKEVVYGQGIATWFSAPALTAAHNTLPRGTEVLVTNTANGKQVKVKIIGGGIYGQAIIDLSPDAFKQLAPLGAGVIQVRLTKP